MQLSPVAGHGSPPPALMKLPIFAGPENTVAQ
jgi:hypothetical protein